jgi:hypothetical protein
MVGDISASDFKDTSYLIINKGLVVDIGYAFSELTGYSKSDVFGKNISEVINELLKINCRVHDLENNSGNSFFLFTNSCEAIEITISIAQLATTEVKLYIFTEIPNSRLKDKLNFVEQLFKDNIMGCAIFSVPDPLLLKVNQTYLDFIGSPYNRIENSIGKSLKEIVSEFAGKQIEEVWNTIFDTQKPFYLKEYRYDKCSKEITYWDGTLTPIIEMGEIKYIFVIMAATTTIVQDRHHGEEQATIIQNQKEQFEQEEAQLDTAFENMTDALMESQKDLLQVIIENMSDSLLIFDEYGNYLRLNKSARDTYAPLCGRSKRIGDGRKHAKYYDANGYLIPHEEVPGRRVIRGEKLIGYRMKIQAGDNIVYTDINGTPVYDKAGNLVAGVLCCRNVTEKTKMDEALKESEAKYKGLFNNMLMGHSYYQIITNPLCYDSCRRD